MRLVMQSEDAAMLRITEAQTRRVLAGIYVQIHAVRLAVDKLPELSAVY